MRTRHHHTHRSSPVTRIVLGAATLVAGGVLFATDPLGASGTDDATFVPITPCRLFDTRPAPQTVGPRDTPLGPDETVTWQATGAQGDCTIPGEATAISINATAVGASEQSYATFFPAGAERPHSSSLNYAPGTAPTPNAIDVRLSADGRFSVYNASGTVHLVGDITGYYTRGTLDQLTAAVAAKADTDDVYTRSELYTRAEIDALLAGLVVDGYTDDEIDAMLSDKANRTAVYAQHEVDVAIATAVAGKADAADVYTKAELDVLHQLLYTKDEVDELLVADRVWAAEVDDDGTKLADGPYTASRMGLGWYRISFQLAPYDVLDTVEPIVAASPRCGGVTSIAGKSPIVAGGTLQLMIVDVLTLNLGGGLVDCPVEVMLRLVD